MVGITARHRVIFQITKAAGKCHVFGACDVLIAKEQHPVLEQC